MPAEFGRRAACHPGQVTGTSQSLTANKRKTIIFKASKTRRTFTADFQESSRKKEQTISQRLFSQLTEISFYLEEIQSLWGWIAECEATELIFTVIQRSLNSGMDYVIWKLKNVLGLSHTVIIMEFIPPGHTCMNLEGLLLTSAFHLIRHQDKNHFDVLQHKITDVMWL